LTATATATESANADSASLSRTVDVVITHAQSSAFDTVITNTALGADFTVPMSAFLYNDVGAASITAISSASGLTASLSGSNVVINDASPAGGSLNYTASTSAFDLDTNSTVVKTSTSTVTVSRDASGAMDGTGADNILVDTLITNTTMNGGAGNDVLVSTAASGGDTLNGGAGNDMLTGGAGADIFVWNFADRGTLANPARDVITDFNTASYGLGGDRLDLRDILQGTATTEAALDGYLDFSKQGSDTVINVRPTGAGGEMTQQIVLQGVDLTSNGTLNDQQIIQDLISKGKLQTD
jgi:Ca2+-binding RTX toxin-like protein